MVHEIAAGCNSASSKPMAALPSSKKVARHVKMMLDRIRAAHGANQRKLERHLICSYLNSFDARCEAVRAALRGLKPHRRPKATQVYSIVRSLDPWQGTEEPVIVNWKIKDANANSCRITMDFGPINRALQYLTHRLLAATADLHPRQFAVRGGVHAAIAHVAKARAEGFGWCAEIDIADCYPSFEGEKLLGLFNLPEEVIEHVITCKDLNLTLGSHPVVVGPASDDEGNNVLLNEALAEARQGIPQGSAVSPLVAELLLAMPLKHLPEGGEVCVYADNLLIMAKDESKAVSMIQALESALAAHPAGQLRPNIRLFKPDEPIDFLGHRFFHLNGAVHIHPSPRNASNFETKLKQGLKKLKNTKSPVKRRLCIGHELATYVRSWTAAFKLCDDIQSLKKTCLTEIKKKMPSVQTSG
jgi:hypothetical protein